MATLKNALYPPYRTVPAHITKTTHAVKMECSAIIYNHCDFGLHNFYFIWKFDMGFHS